MKRFLDYISGKEPSSDFTRRLEEALVKAREHKEWEVEYMTLQMRDQVNIKKGREEGRKEGMIQMLLELVSKGVVTIAFAAQEMNCSESRLIEMLEERGLNLPS